LDAKGDILAIYTKQINLSLMSYTLTERDIYGTHRLGAEYTQIQLISPLFPVDTFNRYLGCKRYELGNQIGNVFSVISDRKIPISFDTASGTSIDHYEADIISSQDYYPFGWDEPARNFNSSSYIFGFNGKLKDDEVYGNGNEYNFGARIFDPRIGRFLSLDPQSEKYPYLTPFCNSANNPILFIDYDGKGPIIRALQIGAWPYTALAHALHTTISLDITGTAAAGLGFAGAGSKSGVSIAVDPQGDFGVVLKFGAFADGFSEATGWAASTATGTGKKGGLSGGNVADGGLVSDDIGLNFNWGAKSITDLGGKAGDFVNPVAPSMDIKGADVVSVGISASSESFGVSLGVGLGAVVAMINTDNLVLATNFNDLGKAEDSYDDAKSFADKNSCTLSVTVKKTKNNQYTISINAVSKDSKKVLKSFEAVTLKYNEKKNSISTTTVHDQDKK
jgi:RHS repeat-associated protein